MEDIRRFVTLVTPPFIDTTESRFLLWYFSSALHLWSFVAFTFCAVLQIFFVRISLLFLLLCKPVWYRRFVEEKSRWWIGGWDFCLWWSSLDGVGQNGLSSYLKIQCVLARSAWVIRFMALLDLFFHLFGLGLGASKIASLARLVKTLLSICSKLSLR